MNRIHIGPFEFYGCHEVHERLEPFLDGELPRQEKRHVAFHLVICRECALLFRFEKRLEGRVRLELNQAEPPLELQEKVHNALKQARRTDEFLPEEKLADN